MLVLGFVLSCLQGCETLNDLKHKIAPIVSSNTIVLCETSLQQETFGDFCSLDNWLLFAFATSEMAWPERSAKINELGDDSRSLLIKALLSQGADTPYRKRLRAQNWVVKISTESSSAMKHILDELVFKNSQHLLEFESAVTILSRVNARQQKTIIDLQAQLEAKQKEINKQQEQVRQLLKIETDLLEKNRSEDR